MADPIFEDPRLAALYDPLDGDRTDLDLYTSFVSEVSARSVLDLGCGTGTLAVRLAELGLLVTAVDPAAASLDIARAKPFGDRVRWILGDAGAVPPLRVDVATMTANVAQAIVDPEAWLRALRVLRRSLRPGGHLVFETRRPEARAWEAWTRASSERVEQVAGVGSVRCWVEVLDVTGPLVTFRWTWVLPPDAMVLTSDSTLRFRTEDEVREALRVSGLTLERVCDAPDRPGRELVFVATREGVNR